VRRPKEVVTDGEESLDNPRRVWVVRVGGVDGELRPWHCIYVYNIHIVYLLIVCKSVYAPLLN